MGSENTSSGGTQSATGAPSTGATEPEKAGDDSSQGAEKEPGSNQPEKDKDPGESKDGDGDNDGEGTPKKDSSKSGEDTGAEKSEKDEPGSEQPKDDPEPEKVPDCEDGDEANCSELPDGAEIQFPTGTPVGGCKYGKKVCSGGKWGACKGAVGPKEKDTCEAGNDDSCNGVPNEGCDCSANETRPCGSDTGACKKGVQTCGEDGTWGSECKGEVGKKKEICDGRADEDCDGLSDREDVLDCECLNGDPKQKCSLSGMGDCGLGVKSCKDGKWARCEARFSKSAEACGKRSDFFGEGSGDEDCDGSVDEHFGGIPKGCQTYILDEDFDGFGAVGYSANSSTMSPLTFGCFCKEPSGANWRRASGKSSVNSDCGDCDRNVKPGQTRYFGEASACLQNLGRNAFDYNCKNGAEKEITQPMRCVKQGDKCIKSGFWSGNAPACGEGGRAGICTPVPTDDGECKVFSAEDIQIQNCR